MDRTHNSNGHRSARSDAIAASSFGQTLLGVLPFLAFGLACVLSKESLSYYGECNWLAFYLLALLGLGVGWVRGFPRWSFALLLYDENHHPYLLVFMIASTMIIAGGAWGYMQGRRSSHQAFSLVTGILLALVVNKISEATWDWRAYYGLPAVTEPWYTTARGFFLPALFVTGLLLSPGLLSLVQRTVSLRRAR